MRTLTCLLMGLGCLAGSLPGAEPNPAGLPVGARPGPYSFLVANGPQKGQQTCYVCETADKPGVIVFARKLTPALGGLLVGLDPLTARAKDPVRVWMTVLGEKTVAQDDLSKWVKSQGLKGVPTGVFDDPVDPPAYRLGEAAEVTVLAFRNKKVVASFSWRADEWTGEEARKAIEAVTKSLP